MANKIGIVMALDGEKEFAQGLKTATSAAKEAQSSLKALDEKYSGSANSMEALKAKQEALTNAQEKYQAKLDAAQAGEDHAQTNLKKTQQAYEELKNKVNDAQKALEDMTSSGLGKGDEAYDKQAKSVDDLNKALTEQGVQVDKAQQKVYDYGTKVNGAQSEVDKINQEVEKNSQYLSEAEASADGCATSIDQYGNEVQQTTSEVNQFSSETQEAETVTTSWSDKLKQAFANAAVNAGMKLLREGVRELIKAFEEAIQVGMEFQASLSNVQALSGATSDEMSQLSAKAQELGSSTKFTASEVSDAFGYMSLAGWDTEQMLDGISGVLDLAAASGMELADASDMITDYLTAFNMEASEATTVADELAYAQANSNTTAEQLGEAYSNCAANLNAAGQDIETVTAMLEAMANQGKKGSEAGTGLNAVMRDITTKMKDGAIAIGDTTVQVADQEGNFRDLTDIIKDVEAATEGMGDAEQQAALKSTFTSRSLTTMNLLLNEGADSIAQYEEELRGASGAASDMADTMQDNLQGDITKLNSALQGLGIQIESYFDSTLRSAAQAATTAISGITAALSPQETAIEAQEKTIKSMVDDIKSANDDLSSIMEASQATVDEAADSSERISLLGEQLLSLNDIEDKTVTQKDRMNQIVGELSESVPALADAFDQEQGKVLLTNDAIEKLIQSSKDLELVNAMTTSLSDEMQALADATLAYEKANNDLEILETEASFWSDVTDAVSDFQVEINNSNLTVEDAEKAQSDLMAIQQMLEDAFHNGTISEAEYSEAMAAFNDCNYEAIGSMSDTADQVGEVANLLYGDYGSAAETATEETAALKDTMDEADASYTQGKEILEELTESQLDEANAAEKALTQNEVAKNLMDEESESAENMAEALGESAESQDALLESAEGLVGALTGDIDAGGKLIDQTDKLSDSEEEVTGTVEAAQKAFAEEEDAEEELEETTEELTESLDDLRASAEEVEAAMGTAYTDTFDSVISAYQSAKDELAQGIDIDFRTEFNGGSDETVESMLATAQENTQALQNYEQNLQEVSSHLGEEIAPEFLSYLMDLGTDGANTLEHISKTFEQDNGSELVKEWSDEFLAQMELEDQISEEFAALKLALDGGLEDLGSTEAEWDGLEQSFETAKELVAQDGGEVAESAIEAFEEASAAAQEAGVAIPEGLSEGLESGQYSVEDATAILNSAMQGQFDALAEMASESGIEVSDSLSESVEQGGTAAAEAINSLVDQMNTEMENSSGEIGDAMDSAISEGAEGAGDGAESSMEEAGKSAAEAYASGFESGASAITDAINNALGMGDNADTSQFTEAGAAAAEAFAAGMEEGSGSSEETASALTQAAIAALESAQSDFQSAGQNSAQGYVSGIQAGGSGVQGAATSMASSAASGANSMYGSFVSAGSNMSGGVASGISSGASAAISAATNMAVSALNAAKSALQISSPSKKFRKDVGQQISSGMAFGIKDKASLAGDEATAMSNKVYNNATAWLKKYKKSHDVSQADEKYYWQQVSKHCESGSTAYCNAIAKMIKADTSRRDSNGKKKDTETYYADIFSSASQYLDNLETLENWSLKEEERYWKSVQKQLKKGTQAWYDAQKEINSIQSKIGTVSNMNSLLSAYETYFELSEKAEMQYWDTVRKQYEYGTDERLEADQKYYDAKKKYTEKLEDLEDEYYSKVQDVNDKLKEDIQSLTDEYDSALQQRTEAIAGAFGLFDAFESTSLTGQELLENLQGQAAGYEAWIDAIDALENRGILSEDLMTELTEMGPDQLAAIYALMDLTDEDLTAYQEAYDRKMDASIAQAEKDTADLRADLEKQTAELNAQAEKDLAELKATYDADVASVNTTISSELNSLAKKATTIAEDQTTALVTAINGSAGSTSANKSGNVAILSAPLGEGTPSPLANAPGYASGGRVNQTLAWMDEQLARLGPEMVVSRKDNALLTRLPADSEIIDAGTTDNLLKLGQVDVGALMKTISAQQSAITHYLATSTGTGLNNITIGTAQPVISTKGMETQMGDMQDLISECVDLLKDGQYIYLDSGKLIGATAEDMGIALAKRANRAR